MLNILEGERDKKKYRQYDLIYNVFTLCRNRLRAMHQRVNSGYFG